MLKWKIGDVTVTQLIEITDGSGAIPVLPPRRRRSWKRSRGWNRISSRRTAI